MTRFANARFRLTRRRLSPPLAFVHMPKAGGTGLWNDLDVWLRPIRKVGGWDRSQVGEFADFDSMEPFFGNSIRQTPEAMAADADIIAGHFAVSTLRTRYPDARMMTILREPKSRLLSHWFYLRGYSDQVLEGYGGWGEALGLARLPLQEFLSHPRIACLTDNAMTRMLVWPHPLVPPGGFISPRDDEAIISLAREQMASFDHVDVLENSTMQTDLALWLRRVYGWNFWVWLRSVIPDHGRRTRRNEAKAPIHGERRLLSDELNELTQEIMGSHTRLDRILWCEIATRVMPGVDLDRLATATFQQTVARYATLLDKAQSGEASKATAERHSAYGLAVNS